MQSNSLTGYLDHAGGTTQPVLPDPVSKTPRLGLLLVGGWLVLLLGLGSWSAYWEELRNDAFQLITLGRAVYEGGAMYTNVWENKPPGIAWINALGFMITGGGAIGPWLMPGVIGLGCIGLFGFALKRLMSSTTAIATVALAAAITTLRVYDAPSVNPDFYSCMFDLAAGSLILLAWYAEEHSRRLLFAVAAGVAFGASMAVKQTGVAGLVAVSLVVLLVTLIRPEDRRRLLAVLGWSWVGFAATAAVVACVLFYRDTLGAAWAAAVTFNRDLVSLDALWGVWHSWPRVRAGLEPVQLAMWLGLVGVVVSLHEGRVNRSSQWFLFAMALWLVAQVILALLGPSHPMRYWQSALPPALWLAAAGVFHIELLFGKLQQHHRTTLIVICASLVVLLGRPIIVYQLRSVARAYETSRTGGAHRPRLATVGKELRQAVPEGQRVYVWAYDAGVYVYADRLPASRFTYPRSAEQMEEILADLEAGKAGAILVPQSGSPEFDRWCDTACHQRFDEILAGLHPSDPVENYVLYTANNAKRMVKVRGTP